MEELTMKIEDVEALVDEVADIAYDKAVEVVADTVKLETHKEDIKLVEQSKAWVLSPERKASKKEVEYAVKRLDGVIASRQKPSIRPRIREPTPEQKYQKEENHCYKVLTDYFHLLREWEKKYAPKQPDEEWNPLFAEALYKKNYIEYLLDILLYGSLEERKALVAERRKEVLKLEQRIAELSADRTMHSRRNPKQLRAERER